MSSAPPSPNTFLTSNPFTSIANPSSASLVGNSLSAPQASGPNTTQIQLAERTDIHKACKALEGLLSVLNEYCEAATAVCALQKRMAKALRETAGCKVTGDVAGNALQAAATIFDALADADSRFAKGVDREYDAISGEVKKWFKKLAKEEKSHDERMANANAKIKQAGQVYEKRSKRKGSDAATVTEDHARYIALINTLGPEIAQDKYNHSLLITQRHSTTTHSVAGSLARIADGEWLRLCECVRRSAPTIGPLGQWRALCEGGWLGGAPDALSPPTELQSNPPTVVSNPEEKDKEPKEAAPLKPILEESGAAQTLQKPAASPKLEAPQFNPPGYSTGPPSAATSTQDLTLGGQQQQQQQTLAPPQAQPQAPEPRLRAHSATNSPVQSRNPPLPPADAHPNTNRIDYSVPQDTSSNDNGQPLIAPRPAFSLTDGVDPNTGSVKSLSAFPSPPTHYPPAHRQRSALGLNDDATVIAQVHSLASIASSGLGVPTPSNLSGGDGSDALGRLTESPLAASSDLEDSGRGYRNRKDGELEADMRKDRTAHGGNEHEDMRDRELELQRELEEIQKRRNANQVRRPVPVKAHTSLPLDARGPVSGARHGGYSSVDLRPGQGYRGGAYEDDEAQEFGVMIGKEHGYRSSNDDTPRARGPENGPGGYGHASARPAAMERVDTGMSTSSGTGSLVAAMRNRYSLNSGSLSPPPRNLPKLPLSVNDLAGRYEGNNFGDAPLSPTLSPRARSPPVARQQSLPMMAAAGQRPVTAQDVYQARRTSGSGSGGQQQQVPGDARAGERDLAERRAQERELMEREKELEDRARALERDRMRLQNLRNGRGNDVDPQRDQDLRAETPSANGGGGQYGLRPRERRTSLRHPGQRPPSQMSGVIDDSDLRQRYAYGAQAALASSTSGSPTKATLSPKQYRQSLPPDGPSHEDRRRGERERIEEQGLRPSASGGSSTNVSSHASNCGCESCSISKYRAGPAKAGPEQHRADGPSVPERQRVDSKPEKTKSWMRRLSMPGVGAAFMSDAKKTGGQANGSSTNYSLGSGIGHTPEKQGRGLFSLKNSSTTGLRLPNDAEYRRGEDARLVPNSQPTSGPTGRRSYDVSDMNSRTLAVFGRH